MDMGGKVIIMGDEPAYIDAVSYDGEFALSRGSVHIPYDEKSLVDAIRECSLERVEITDSENRALREVFVQAKHDFDGGDAFVVLNTDLENNKYDVKIRFKTETPRFVEIWDFATGERYSADARAYFEDGFTVINTDLLAGESQCYVLRSEKDESIADEPCLEDHSTTPIYNALDVAYDEPNVCVLDFANWRWEDGEWSSEKREIIQIDRKIRDELKIMRRCEGMLQPWYIKKYDLDTKFKSVEIKFEFDIESLPEGGVTLVGERPERNEFYVNGIKLNCPNTKDFWIDVAFKKFPVPEGILKLGRNEITVKTLYKWSTHLEAVYLIGEFGVRTGHKISTIINKRPDKLKMASYAEQDMPFYSGNVTFKLPYKEYHEYADFAEDDRIFLSARYFGAAVRVTDGADLDEIIAWEPYEIDVTEAVRAQRDLEITLLGTRKNTFGPLHTRECVVHRCGHGSFTTSGEDWIDEYNLIEDGLREIRFTVKK